MNKEAKECEAEEDAKVNKSMKVFQPNDSAQLSHHSKHANYKHEIRIFKTGQYQIEKSPNNQTLALTYATVMILQWILKLDVPPEVDCNVMEIIQQIGIE